MHATSSRVPARHYLKHIPLLNKKSQGTNSKLSGKTQSQPWRTTQQCTCASCLYRQFRCCCYLPSRLSNMATNSRPQGFAIGMRVMHVSNQKSRSLSLWSDTEMPRRNGGKPTQEAQGSHSHNRPLAPNQAKKISMIALLSRLYNRLPLCKPSRA